jgi:glycerol-3-phosphate acyltransferase PlsY
LIGAIPTGYLFGRVLRGIDIRKYGSGGTGFTNVMRTMGKTAAMIVLAIDVGKGSLVVGTTALVTDVEIIKAVAGSMAIIGHMYPAYTKFEGGRGVATAFGALLILSPIAAGAAAVGLLVIAATRYVSAGSLSGTAIAAGTVLLLVILHHHDWGILVFAASIIVLIPIRHIGNIIRLLRGTENRLQPNAKPKRKQRERHI